MLMQTNKLISGVRLIGGSGEPDFPAHTDVHMAHSPPQTQLHLKTAHTLPRIPRRDREDDAAALRAAGLFQHSLTERSDRKRCLFSTTYGILSQCRRMQKESWCHPPGESRYSPARPAPGCAPMLSKGSSVHVSSRRRQPN